MYLLNEGPTSNAIVSRLENIEKQRCARGTRSRRTAGFRRTEAHNCSQGAIRFDEFVHAATMSIGRAIKPKESADE